jgi:hypothetical protein
MGRTTVQLPASLAAKARSCAKQAGVSLERFIHHAVRQQVQLPRSVKPDPLFDLETYDGPAPADGSVNHDRYLYGKNKASRA